MQDLDWEIIITLHETNSISKTAEIFFMSQPSLSRHIRAIETELSAEIILRNNKGCRFTSAGEAVYEKAVKIVDLQNKLKRELERMSRADPKQIKIGAPRTFTCYKLPEILRVFTSQYPEINIELSINDSDILKNELRDGSLDLCFVIGQPDDDEYENVVIAEDNLYAVYSKPIKQSELGDLQLITFPKNNFLRSQIDDWWNSNFDRPRSIKFRVTNGESCISMIKQGLGYGFFNDKIYFQDVEGVFPIALKNKDGSEFKNYTNMVRLKNLKPSVAVQSFIDVVVNNFKL